MINFKKIRRNLIAALRRKNILILRKILEPLRISIATPTYSQNDMEIKFLKQFNSNNPGVFIELGANNGLLQSNTYLLQYGLGWSGVLIEPVPRLFEELKNNRASNRVHFINKVMSSFDRDGTTVEIMDVGLMSYMINTLEENQEKEQFETGKKFSKIPPQSYQIPASTLSQVLTQLNIRNVDLLSLDVEGHELGVLQGLDFKKYSPKFILAECNDYENTVNYLSCKGYSIVEKFDAKNILFSKS